MILAVVPILVNAGSAVLPALLAGLATILASLFRPNEWLRLVREKPAMVSLAIGSIAIASWGVCVSAHRVTAKPAAATDWAQVALEIIRSEGRTPPTGQETGAPLNLKPAWEFKPPATSFLSDPVIANGRLYGASCLIDVAGTFGSVFCLDAVSGRPIWQVEKIDGMDLKGFFSSPAITADGRFLIIGEGLHFDTECHLFCFETATGKLHWKIDVPKNHLESSPAILGGMVIVGAGAIERANHLPAESPGYVLCARISDGKVLWQREVIDPESAPAVAPDGSVYIGSGVNGCVVVALSAIGDQIWRASTPYPATGPVSLVDDLVVIGCGRGDFVNADPQPAGAVLAIDRHTGKVRWRTELGDAVLGAVAVHDGKVVCPVRNGKVVALNLADGAEIWNRTVSGGAPVLAGIVFIDQRIYAVSSDGFLAVLDATDGRLIEKHTLNDEGKAGRENLSVSTPAIHGNHLFVGSETGGLRCFIGQ